MKTFFKRHFSQDRILGGVAVLSVTQFGASLAGLIRDRMLAKTFPGLDTVDVYIASFRPSDLMFQMSIMAAFSVALVPLLAKYKVTKDTNGASHLLSGVVAIAALVFGVIALVVAAAFPYIAPYLVQFEGESLQLYIGFGRLALFTNFLFVFGNAFGQYLITVQRYWWYGITPILYTVGTILGTVYLTPVFGSYGPMYGTMGGAIVYVFARFIAALYGGYRPMMEWWHPDLKEMGWLMIPRMLALGALQLQLLLFDTVASGLDSGAVTINAYARNFQAVVVGVIGIALAQSVFSLLSQTAAKKEVHRFWIYLRKGIYVLLGLTIPGAIALVLVTPIAARLVGLTHVFPVFSACLAFYALSIPFESMNHLLLRTYYSLKQTTIPAIFSVTNGMVAILITWYLSSTYGVYSLALGFTAGQLIQLIGLSVFLPRWVHKLSH